MVYDKNYFNRLKYFFWGYSKWRKIKQRSPGLNRGLSSDFCWLRTVNHVKFTERVVCKEKHILVKNRCITTNLSWKDSLWRGNNDSAVKKKFWAQRSVEKAIGIDFWDTKGSITIDFLEKGAIVISDSYCQLLLQNLLYSFNNPSIYIYTYIYIMLLKAYSCLRLIKYLKKIKIF